MMNFIPKTNRDDSYSPNKKNGFDFAAFADSLNSLDSQNMGGWPRAVKIFVCGLILLFIFSLAYALLIRPVLLRLNAATAQQTQLLQAYRDKSSQLRNLQAYKTQMSLMQEDFSMLLKQLPTQTEVPGLIEDISFVGVGSGVRISDIKVDAEIAKTEFIELPLSIQAKGGYHAFGAFVSGLSALPRIVTAQDFDVSVEQGDKRKSEVPILQMNLHAKTYRLSDQPIEVTSLGNKPLEVKP